MAEQAEQPSTEQEEAQERTDFADETGSEDAPSSEERNTPTELTGQRVGRYLVGRRLGSGGAATVYQAYDQVQGRSVALKVLSSGADAVTRSRFRQEARTAGKLRHPHIVGILQVGDAPADGIAYIAMELVEGESLSRLLDRRGQLRPEESCNLLEPITRALAFAHEAGVVHRDVKPSNILLRPASPGSPNSVQLEALDHPVVPLLTDFGIAKALDMPELTSVGRTIGTPAYMSPEQCAGDREVDGRADLYSLGAVLYRCLVGRAPFTGSTTQILHAHVYDPLTIPDDVLTTLPPLVVEILRRSLAKEPGERYAGAMQMADDLARAAGRSPVGQEADYVENEATATLTLASLPAAGPATITRTETVLVPSPTQTAEVAAGSPEGRTETAYKRNAPLLSRPPWFNRLAAGLTGALALVLVVAVLTVASNVLPFDNLLGAEELPTQRQTAVLVDGAAGVGQEPPIETPPTGVKPSPDVTAAGVSGAETATPSSRVTSAGTAGEAADGETGATTATLSPAPTTPPTTVPTPVPTATPTVEPPTPEPQPSPTVETEPTLLPTAEATATPEQDLVGSCPYVPDEAFLTYLNENPSVADELGCPTNIAIPVTVEIQPFQDGLILNRDDIPTIYVRYGNGQWEQHPDRWQPGMPEIVDDPQLAPTGPGLFQPRRGIGLLWAQNVQLRSALGWATAPAQTASGVVQSFSGGLIVLNQESGDLYAFLKSQLRL